MCNKLRNKIQLNNIGKEEEIDHRHKTNIPTILNKPVIFQIDKEKRFRCSFPSCGKKFSNRGNLNIHVKIHSKEKDFPCCVVNCGKIFTTKGNLSSHLKNHNGEKEFVCDYQDCDRTYSFLCRLIIHKRTHTGNKPFQCPHCDKSFNEKGNFITHSRVHSGEKPFKCTFEVCDKSFKAKSHLNDHMKIHLNDRPFECDVCKEKFSRSSILRNHKLVHTGEKPHTCPYPICLRKFADKGNMKNHFKLHYKDRENVFIRSEYERLIEQLREMIGEKSNTVLNRKLLTKSSMTQMNDSLTDNESDTLLKKKTYPSRYSPAKFIYSLSNLEDESSFGGHPVNINIGLDLDKISFPDISEHNNDWNELFNISEVHPTEEVVNNFNDIIPNCYTLFSGNNLYYY